MRTQHANLSPESFCLALLVHFGKGLYPEQSPAAPATIEIAPGAMILVTDILEHLGTHRTVDTQGSRQIRLWIPSVHVVLEWIELNFITRYRHVIGLLGSEFPASCQLIDEQDEAFQQMAFLEILQALGYQEMQRFADLLRDATALHMLKLWNALGVKILRESGGKITQEVTEDLERIATVISAQQKSLRTASWMFDMIYPANTYKPSEYLSGFMRGLDPR